MTDLAMGALDGSEDEELRAKKALNARVAKSLLWVAMVAIVMLFAAFTSGYVVRQSSSDWMEFSLPGIFIYNSTLFIILSSLTLFLAQFAVRKSNNILLYIGLLGTMVFGVLFTWSQFQGYDQLYEMGVYAAGRKSNASGSFLYIITVLHMAHLAGGFIALIITTIKAFLGKYNSDNRTGVNLCAMYWHFMGLLWIYLAGFFGFMHGFDIV